jgi:hypothetical protein
MNSETPEKQSQLIASLREGVSVVQMIFFKELRTELGNRYSDRGAAFCSMLSGAVVNEVFGTPNPEERFVTFRAENNALIEQELLGLKLDFSQLMPALTDALRIQSLCDSQEGNDDTQILTHAHEIGILVVDREVPMPSSFMTLVRELGEQHNLIIAPVQITPEQDQEMVH